MAKIGVKYSPFTNTFGLEANSVTTDKVIGKLSKLAGISLSNNTQKTITSCKKIRERLELDIAADKKWYEYQEHSA